MNSNHDSGTETGTDHSPSRFTAVNGRDSIGSGATPAVPSSSGPNNTGPKQPGLRDQWAKSNHESGNRPGHDQDERLSPKSSSQGAPLENRNKRKRSESRERSLHNAEGPDSSKSPIHRAGDDCNSHPNGPLSGPDQEVRRPSTAPSQTSDTNEGPPAPSANGPWQEYDSHLVHQAQRAQQIDASEAQLVDALQRENHGPESSQRSVSTSHSLPGSTPSVPPAPSNVYPPERSTASSQVAPKRKRVFSNRTKTGCMTCRRRKKKCDEQHPACNNCIRGGFLCEGYSSRSTWQKPSTSKTPVPLQSKEGYPEIGGQYLPESIPHHDRQPGMTEQVEAGKMRTLGLDGSDRSIPQYNTSPTGVGSSHGPWSKQGWPATGHPAYVSEHMAKAEYREVPPIHELSREGPPKSDYPVVPSIRDLSHGRHPKSNMPLFQGGMEQRPMPAATMNPNSPQAQARMALSIEHQLSGHALPSDDTQKAMMIRGERYRPFDVQLVEERDRCKAALFKFNNACNPLNGISSKEQNRLLKEIFVPPSSSVVNSPPGASRSAGSLGTGVVVEAPFKCHYGYNIHIGEDVMISENCLLVDDCPIRIGAHTWIGPNVQILSSMAVVQMQERKGPQSAYMGRPVTIEEDCYIGAGAIIFPGVRLGRGAYVGPGELVASNIDPYRFQGMKPHYM
ncbi:hypothetical protein N7474_010202 [Penicillium riverlandense]|uniref:uncharacterized protein n=1 Tax=Penicillium riverlandense TaxID=1903569 RepID=UPI002549BB5C|nr:uncharacterized protein N7474_010202 [Penicillium riverlandense]KAJ5808933.1 hypothetical protein N7474_010202 [Penicillium riverlandense]